MNSVLMMASLLLVCGCAWCSQGAGEKSSPTLYVLSSPEVLSSPDDVPHSELLFIDPLTGNIRRTLRAGFSADAQISPDGQKIYVSSSYVSGPDSPDTECFIETYDTATGALIARAPNPDGQQFTSDIHKTDMAISPSGNWLYITKLRSTAESYEIYIAAFDTSKQRFLPGHVSLSECEAPVLLPSKRDLHLAVVCPDSTYIRQITFNQLDALDTPLPFRAGFARSGLAVVIHQPQAGSSMFISGDGHVMSVDYSTGLSTELSESLRSGKDLGLVQALLSRNQHEAYFGSAVEDHDSREPFDKLVVVDANSGSVMRTANVQPFFDLAVSEDEKTIYLLHPFLSKITAIDATTMKEAKSIRIVGEIPYYAVVR